MITEDVRWYSAPCILDDWVGHLPGNKDVHLEYASDIALSSDNLQALKLLLDCSAIEVSRCGMGLVPSKCQVFLKDWQQPGLAITLCVGQLEIFNSFKNPDI